jgi:hypothetical protein
MENTKNASGTWTRPFIKGDRVSYTFRDKSYFGTITDTDPSNVKNILVDWDTGIERWENSDTVERA